MHRLFGERFLGKREPAWHGLGQVFNENLSLSEAFERAGLMYRIVTAPVFYETASGDKVEIPNRQAVLRLPTDDDPEERLLDITSEQFRFLSNDVLAGLFEPLVEEWPVETVGALGNGETVFFTLDGRDWDYKNDPLKLYFFVHDTKKVGTTLRIMFTPVRVVCQNTLIVAEKQSVVGVSIPHRPGISEDVELRVKILQEMQAAQTRTLDAFKLLMDGALTEDEAKAVLLASYPVPKESDGVMAARQFVETYSLRENPDSTFEKALTKMSKRITRHDEWASALASRREAANELYQKFNDEQTHLARTPWAVYNAVVETEDYRTGHSTLLKNALLGDRAETKRRAFSAAMKVI